MSEDQIDLKKENPETKSVETFWLIIVTDSADQKPACIECADQISFEQAYKQHVLEASEELHAFAFKGKRIRLGSLSPVGAFEIDGETVKVGLDTSMVDDSGHFTPLIHKPKTT